MTCKRESGGKKNKGKTNLPTVLLQLSQERDSFSFFSALKRGDKCVNVPSVRTEPRACQHCLKDVAGISKNSFPAGHSRQSNNYINININRNRKFCDARARRQAENHSFRLNSNPNAPSHPASKDVQAHDAGSRPGEKAGGDVSSAAVKRLSKTAFVRTRPASV